MRLVPQRLAATRRRKRRRPREEAPREIVPAPGKPGGPDPFDAARERLKAQIPPRED